MTHDPSGEEIPELAGRLEGSLDAPDPAAIHAGLGQRQAARKRVLSVAGAFVAVLAITGAALALTNDDTTETVTADDAALDELSQQIEREPAVADDSAPFETMRLRMLANEWSVVQARGVTSLVDQTGKIWFGSGDLSNSPAGDTITYSAGCRGSSYRIEWLDDTQFTVIDEIDELDRIPTMEAGQICIEGVERQRFLSTGEAVAVYAGSERPDIVTMQNICPPDPDSAMCDMEVWSVDLLDPNSLMALPSIQTVEADVQIHECANGSTITLGSDEWLAWELPAEWAGQGKVQVTVVIDDNKLVATDLNGLTAPFVRDDGQGGVLICMGFNYEQPGTTPPPATTIVVAPTTLPPETTTTTGAISGPPSYAPSSDTRLSGRWELVSLWAGNDPLTLDEFSGRLPSLSIVGRQWGGSDGCNDNGAGLFFPTEDGRLQLQSGNSTAMLCIGNDAVDAYASLMSSASEWGRTSGGNLVVAGGDWIGEYQLVEAIPQGPLNVDDPLNTIWNGDRLGDYDSLSSDNPEVTLTIWDGSAPNTKFALLNLWCAEYGFDVTHEGEFEGSIEFVATDVTEAGAEPCEPSGNGATALTALDRADYFAVAEGGVMFWDGPNPLATFGAEGE